MNVRQPEKRSAIEPASALLTHEADTYAVSAQRPLTTALGAIFVWARAVAGVLWLLTFWLLWPEIVELADVEDDIAPYVLGLIFGVGALTVVLLVIFGWAIWRGSNAARVIVMCVLTLSVMTSAVEYFLGNEEITIRTTLLTVALDILVLLALSGRDARAWARRPKPRRRSHSEKAANVRADG